MRHGVANLLCDFGLHTHVSARKLRWSRLAYEDGVDAIIDVLAVVELLVDVRADAYSSSKRISLMVDLCRVSKISS